MGLLWWFLLKILLQFPNFDIYKYCKLSKFSFTLLLIFFSFLHWWYRILWCKRVLEILSEILSQKYLRMNLETSNQIVCSHGIPIITVKQKNRIKSIRTCICKVVLYQAIWAHQSHQKGKTKGQVRCSQNIHWSFRYQNSGTLEVISTELVKEKPCPPELVEKIKSLNSEDIIR